MAASRSTSLIIALLVAIAVGAVVGLLSGVLGLPVWLRTTLIVVAVGAIGLVMRSRSAGDR